ncbi:ankyrin repeat domain-containing protein [Streptomyces sp. CBMA29]|uniref:ankyrin repeat domain-containing protein n=1 Tax=Streptomyces sp. CBMA29 TaxID=1896314 RepID=UPI001661B4AF|nr:ankyrin repeat domain-containing protein [Streptomyces sp. CBMA29]MBD0738446.1 hypothetical protein [Streptomyces sp. CBMA29]
MEAGCQGRRWDAARRSGGEPEIVAEFVRQVRDVDAVQPRAGNTALWEAVCWGHKASVRTLLAAGANPWRPQTGGRSPGGLALTTTTLAPYFADRPDAVPLTEGERAAQEDTDRRAAAFAGLYTDGLSARPITTCWAPTAPWTVRGWRAPLTGGRG